MIQVWFGLAPGRPMVWWFGGDTDADIENEYVQIKSTGQQLGQPQSTVASARVRHGQIRFWYGSDQLGQTELTRSTRVNSASELSRSTRLTRKVSWSTHNENSAKVLEYCRMHASESHLGSDITKSHLASFAQEYSGCISKTKHGWNRRTMKSRVLSGRSVFRKT
ncbi:uncharacterized protein LOC110896620 [Helianthus annuus]|uniref:uncharacterized protein LOC110896620 n=1 Tax=Helianthus annuus TaxID=4232 RepID=UPI0016532BBD|nr:uncharacterized protein LOC110896620 [Helianthus annuus]